MNIDLNEILEQAARGKPTKEHATAFLSYHLGINLNDPKFACFLTGSVAFDEQKHGSDIDIVLPILAKQSACLKMEETGFLIQDSFYNDGVHGDYVTDVGPIKVNVLFLHPLDFVVWKRAGGMYKLLPHSLDREARHALFELLRATVKTSFRLAGIFIDSKNFQQY